MPTRDEFVEHRLSRWRELDRLLSGGPLHRLPPTTISRVAFMYRALCADLMQARSLGCGVDVTDHLDSLAGRAHNALYASQPYRITAAWRLLASGFPVAVRKNWRLVLLSSALFWLPLLLGYVGAQSSDEFARAVLPRHLLEQMADSYADGFGSGRESGVDAAMAGFYVYNNVSIAFRCFATGVLFGAGSVFFLIYNGLVTGTVLGYVVAAGSGQNIFTFICGHGPLELTAIVLAGAAGLKLGYALVRTDGRTRLGSLRAQAGELLELTLGAAAMLLLAAAVEAFWSPSAVSPPVKWVAAAVLALLVIVYFTLAGRGQGGARAQGAA